MCGIYGYIGNNNAYEQVIKGLGLLQYRGYDSCGIAYYNNGFKINKTVGTLNKLKPVEIKTNIAFGHTRWATNGVVNKKNAHPHTSFNKEFNIVHNGIINNASDIKKDLLKKGITFKSETDTEVIVNYLSTLKDIDNNISKLYKTLSGSFSLIIGNKKGELYLLKQFSPLHILKAEDGIYISSDISSLPTGELYSLNDGDIIKISNNEIKALHNTKITYKQHNNIIKQLELNGFNHYMIKEINETPLAIKNTYQNLNANEIVSILKKYINITLTGCGTAYNSCLIGETLFKKLNYQTQCVLANNYEVNNKINKKHLHIIVSQSGETADCIRVAEQIKQHNGKFLLITNESTSTLAKKADFVITINAGKELAVASTKTYCCQLFVFAYIYNLMQNKNYKLNIDEFYQKIDTYINTLDVSELSRNIAKRDKLILVAKDVDYLTMLEASLKIREIDYIFTLPMFSGELKHGTLSLIDENMLTLSLNTENNNKMDLCINEIKSRKGRVEEMEKYINVDVEQVYKPIFAIIPFQLLSYEVAIINNLNPDMPRNLAKSVTVE